MNRKWSRILLSLTVLFLALTGSNLAFAYPVPVPAPEFDPTLAIQGFSIAAGAALLIGEHIRRRK